jgi:hypothetical protein
MKRWDAERLAWVDMDIDELAAALETPAVDVLLDYWRTMTAKDRPVTFGPDRAAAILAYLDEQVALVAQLRGTLQFNREQAAKRDPHRADCVVVGPHSLDQCSTVEVPPWEVPPDSFTATTQ